MRSRFVPLQVYSWYSLLEGVDSPAVLALRAAECGYEAAALTDLNSLAGAVEFSEAARQAGLRPILGTRLRHQTQRATLLISDPPGWKSLCKLISRIHATGPPPLAKLLAEHNEGLQLLCDDVFLLKPPLPEAYRGRLWVELVRPGRTEEMERALVDVGAGVGAKPVASPAAHFALPAGHATYRLLSAIRQGQTLEQLPRTLPVVPDHHLAGPEEIHERFLDLPDALANSAKLAERCRSDVLPRGVVLPPATVPAGQDPLGYLRLLCERALPLRGGQDEPAVRGRLEQELKVVAQHDLASYFLAVAEIAAHARKENWPMSLRGSAASSLVCYLLEISDVNPLRYGLKLERFLHAGRDDIPDIDLDFANQYRSGLFTWVVRHFGPGNVARVGSWHHYGPRSAFAAAAALHGVAQKDLRALSEALGDDLEGLGKDPEPAGLDVAPAAFPLEPAVWPQLLASARLLLKRPYELTTHPSGFVMTAEPTENYAPLQRYRGVNLTQLDMNAAEHIGLIKIDLLSNRALSTLSEARQHLAVLAPADLRAPAQEDTDPATLDLLARGDTLGISQVETPAMRLLLRQLRPRSLPDLVQALAVTRPAAASGGGREAFLRRRCGREAPAYAHPALEPVLRENFGVLLYDDDLISVIEALARVPPAEADRLRKRLTAGEGALEAGEIFLGLCEKNEVPRAAAQLVLGQIGRFREYSFCKAHAVSYALIAWQESYLKAHCPLAFWTAALNNHQGNYPRRVYTEAAKRSGLQFFLPCVNRSQVAFSQEVAGIRVGLGAVRALDKAACEGVLQQRKDAGPFQSLADFRRRCTSVSGQDLALLIRAGGFDFTGRSRAALLRDADALHQGRLPPWWEGRDEVEPWPFDGLPADYTLARQWQDEWDLLGFLAGPPLMSLVRACVAPGLVDSRDLLSHVGDRVRMAGLVAVAREPSPSGGERTNLTLEDEWGLIEVRVVQTAEPAPSGPVVVVEGEVEERHGQPVVVAAKLARPLPGAVRVPPATPLERRDGVARPA
jgi:DNA-directed DNA polymerase III PolC